MSSERFATIVSIGETIRELGAVPYGHLFNAVHVKYPLTTANDFRRVIDTLKRCKLVEEKNHVLRWIGPALPDVETP